MSALGDKFREAAERCDKMPNLVCAAAIVTESKVFLSLADNPKDEDEARALVARGLHFTVSHDPQTTAARMWTAP